MNPASRASAVSFLTRFHEKHRVDNPEAALVGFAKFLDGDHPEDRIICLGAAVERCGYKTDADGTVAAANRLLDFVHDRTPKPPPVAKIKPPVFERTPILARRPGRPKGSKNKPRAA